MKFNVLLLALATLLLAGCSGGADGESENSAPIPAFVAAWPEVSLQPGDVPDDALQLLADFDPGLNLEGSGLLSLAEGSFVVGSATRGDREVCAIAVNEATRLASSACVAIGDENETVWLVTESVVVATNLPVEAAIATMDKTYQRVQHGVAAFEVGGGGANEVLLYDVLGNPL